MPHRAEPVALTRQEHIAVIHIQRPQVRNAINSQLLSRLAQTLHKVESDSSIHGVLLTGAGDDFAAGADLNEIQELNPAAATRFAEQGQTLCRQLEELPKPIIAAAQGYCLGTGLELALACDYILAADNAAFGFKELAFGTVPAFGGIQRLCRLVGAARAKDMLFTGRLLAAAEAQAYGIVNQLHSPGQLQQQALAHMQGICAHGRYSLKLAKEVIFRGQDAPIGSGCLLERDAFAVCFATADQQEGMQAFLDKRSPRFTDSPEPPFTQTPNKDCP